MITERSDGIILVARRQSVSEADVAISIKKKTLQQWDENETGTKPTKATSFEKPWGNRSSGAV